MDRYTVKIQASATGSDVLIYPTTGDDFTVELSGDGARDVMRSYDLAPMGKTFATAELDENGLLHLGAETDDDEQEQQP